MTLPVTLPPVANLALYLLIVIGMIALAVALDRWLAVAELRPATRRRYSLVASTATAIGAATTAAPASRPVAAPHRRTLPIPALLPRLAARERAALRAIVGGALALRVLFPETFPDFLTGAELARASEALRINAGVGAANSPGGFPAILAGAWTFLGTTLPLERLLTALCVVAALVPFHALLRRLVGGVPALGATLLLGVSRPALLAGRGGEADPAIVLLAPLAAWLLLHARERGDGRTWALCGVSAAALLLGGAAGWATLIALAVWLGITLRRDAAATPLATRRTAAGLLFAGGFALLIFLLATLAGGGGLRAAIPFTLDGGSGAGPLAALGARGRAFVGALFAVLTGGALDPSAAAWRDPFSALLAVAGAILALRLGRKAALWWCLALIPPLLAGPFGGGDPHATIRILLLLPGYAFVALALDRLLRWRRLGTPLAQLAAIGVVAVLAVANVASYALWSNTPATRAAQGPTIATRDFYLWRDYQVGNLATGRGIVGPEEYATLAPGAIAEQSAAARRIAAGGTARANAAPRDDIGQELATIGTGENGGHLDTPRALAIDRQGGYYVADTARGTIVRFGAHGLYIGEWATAEIGRPWAIVAAPDNTLLVLDADTGRIGRYDRQGAFLGLVLAPDSPTATRGLGLGLDGKVYVAQTAASRVLRLDPRAGGGQETVGGGGPAATFDQPTAALADARGNVAIYEPDGARLRGVVDSGLVRFDRAAPRSDTLNAGSLATLPDGRIALVDAPENRVLLYSATGDFVGSFPVAGTPRGLAVTPTGLIAVTDLQGKSVRLYALTTP
jgi:hypothetical protein